MMIVIITTVSATISVTLSVILCVGMAPTATGIIEEIMTNIPRPLTYL